MPTNVGASSADRVLGRTSSVKIINLIVVIMASVEVRREVGTKLVGEANTGIQVVKGGITEEDGFFSSIVAAYANLVNNPIVLIIGALLLLVYFVEDNKNGPLEELKDILSEIRAKSHMSWERGLVGLTLKLVNFLITFKTQFIQVGFAVLPYMAKPSTNSMYLTMIHIIMIFLFRSWDDLVFILISQAHFLFISLRKPFYKLVIIIAAIVLLFVEIEIGGRVVNMRKNVNPEKI